MSAFMAARRLINDSLPAPEEVLAESAAVGVAGLAITGVPGPMVRKLDARPNALREAAIKEPTGLDDAALPSIATVAAAAPVGELVGEEPTGPLAMRCTVRPPALADAAPAALPGLPLAAATVRATGLATADAPVGRPKDADVAPPRIDVGASIKARGAAASIPAPLVAIARMGDAAITPPPLPLRTHTQK